jgi:hypothetical protein
MRQSLICTFDSRVPVTVMVVSPFFTGAVSCACAGTPAAMPTTTSNHRVILTPRSWRPGTAQPLAFYNRLVRAAPISTATLHPFPR